MIRLKSLKKFGGHWATTTFSAGDLIIFNMFLMHASLVNTSNKIRITADTRYQLASEPIDERWVGEKRRDITRGSSKMLRLSRWRNHGKGGASNVFNPLNPPYQGDFNLTFFNPLNPPCQGDFKR